MITLMTQFLETFRTRCIRNEPMSVGS